MKRDEVVAGLCSLTSLYISPGWRPGVGQPASPRWCQPPASMFLPSFMRWARGRGDEPWETGAALQKKWEIRAVMGNGSCDGHVRPRVPGGRSEVGEEGDDGFANTQTNVSGIGIRLEDSLLCASAATRSVVSLYVHSIWARRRGLTLGAAPS